MRRCVLSHAHTRTGIGGGPKCSQSESQRLNAYHTPETREQERDEEEDARKVLTGARHFLPARVAVGHQDASLEAERTRKHHKRRCAAYRRPTSDQAEGENDVLQWERNSLWKSHQGWPRVDKELLLRPRGLR